MPATRASAEPSLRPARDADAPALQRIIADLFANYPHCFLELELEEPGLRAPGQFGFAFWVLDEPGAGVIGCVGCAAGAEPGVVELRKLYVREDRQGRGFGGRLIEQVEAQARRQGAHTIELWSDTRFTTAHRVYEKRGYRPTGRERALHDLSDTREFHYSKRLAPTPAPASDRP